MPSRGSKGLVVIGGDVPVAVIVHVGRLAVLVGVLTGPLQDYVCQADHSEDGEYDQHATPARIGRTLGAATGGKHEHRNDHGGQGGDESLDDVHENPLTLRS